MVRKWTEEEERALVAALEIQVARGVTSPAEAADLLLQQSESISTDKDSPFTKRQIEAKIHSMSARMHCGSARLLQNWGQYRGGLLAKWEQRERSVNRPGQADVDGPSARTLVRLKLKRGSTSRTTSSSSPQLSLNKEEDDGSEGTSGALSTAGSDEYVDPDLEVTEAKRRRAPPNSTPRTSMDLDAGEQNLIKATRQAFGHGHWEDNPRNPDVDRALDNVLEKMGLAIKSFRKAIPTVGLNTMRLTTEAAELSSHLFSPAISNSNSRDQGRFLTVLFTDPAITIDLAL
jgi:hypothetical protein